MNRVSRPGVTIEHELPGRLRVRLSHALRDPDRMKRLVAEHVGIREVRYTAVSHSVLVTYDKPDVTPEEIVIRISLALSLEHDSDVVRVLARPATRELTDSAFYSGVALLAALGQRLLGPGKTVGATLDWLAGVTTAGAALDHGWMEYRRRGNFDPEVLSVTYLLTALLRGNALPAAIFTWATTFGRHLARMPAPGVEVRPAEIGADGGTPRLEVVIGPDRAAADKMSVFGLLPTMLFNAVTGGGPAQRVSLIDQIRHVSDLHGEVLEGVSDFRHGIPLRVR